MSPLLITSISLTVLLFAGALIIAFDEEFQDALDDYRRLTGSSLLSKARDRFM
jgi:hypothetical protein